MKITFYFQKAYTLKQRKKLKHFIVSIFKSEKRTLSDLSFVFCSDSYLLEINNKFLHHNFFTDIITFDLTPIDKKAIEAEIYISVDRVRENSKIFKSSTEQEFHRVIFHGVLHLCGYTDKSKSQKLIMTQMEHLYLEKYVIFT